MPASLVSLAAEHLDGAAALLADRHRRHREAEPLLPPRYEEPVAARQEIEALLAADGASGVVAVDDGRVAGYLVASRRDDAVWGPNVWVELAGHAAEDGEVLRDLYASAAADWVRDGRTMHYVLAPADDDSLVDAWFRLGFGQQHAHGIRDVPADASFPDGVREATPGDVDALVELAPLLSEHQALSPVFSAGPRYTDAEARADIEEDIASPSICSVLAEVDGRVVGALVVCPVEMSSTHAGLARPEGAALLAWAATRPDVRGSGAGRALTEAGFAWARDHGYDVMVSDWRTTNLLSSRFWPRRGFRPTFLRLHRAIVKLGGCPEGGRGG